MRRAVPADAAGPEHVPAAARVANVRRLVHASDVCRRRQNQADHARITALHNGVPIHLHRQITAKTGGGKAEGPQPFPINLQDHGNPVVFRNIWIVRGHWAMQRMDPSFAGRPIY